MPKLLRSKPRLLLPDAHRQSPYDFLANDVDAFNLPLYRRMGDGPMFIGVAIAELNLTRLLAAYHAKLWRAITLEGREPERRWRARHRQLIFELEPECFLWVDGGASCCRVVARDPDLATYLARQVADRFRVRRRTPRPVPVFHLLSTASTGIAVQEVRLADPPTLPRADLDLLYGDGFAAWDADLAATLAGSESGTVILRGPPGTGKTTYVRYLIARLSPATRFYFLPVSTGAALLTSPKLVPFWAAEARAFPGSPKVVILEDAEDLIAERADQTRGQVADLLQVSSGLLSDFMQMKVICTVNCPLDRLDPAIVRAGRLLAAWEFRRLPPERARRVAEHHGLTLAEQADYSLAEVFRGPPKMSARPTQQSIGFAASQ